MSYQLDDTKTYIIEDGTRTRTPLALVSKTNASTSSATSLVFLDDKTRTCIFCVQSKYSTKLNYVEKGVCG